MKTNAARLLEQLGIAFELRTYEVELEDLTPETVATKIGMPASQVFKTLLAHGDRSGHCFAVIPGDAELDLKRLATHSGDRKVQLVAMKDLQALTGYVRGGVTVLGAKKAYPVFVDESVRQWDVISISAGVRGTQILIGPEAYLRATQATVGEIANRKSGS